jgi:hypothetical protein
MKTCLDLESAIPSRIRINNTAYIIQTNKLETSLWRSFNAKIYHCTFLELSFLNYFQWIIYFAEASNDTVHTLNCGDLDVGQSRSSGRHALQRHWQVSVKTECWWAGQVGQDLGRHCSLLNPRQVHTSHLPFSMELFTANLANISVGLHDRNVNYFQM